MRLALIIGNSQYLDKKLSYIPAPEADITALSDVLNDRQIGAFDHVEVIQNQPYSFVKRAITSFYNLKKPGDLLLLYFSGHGIYWTMKVVSSWRSGILNTICSGEQLLELRLSPNK